MAPMGEGVVQTPPQRVARSLRIWVVSGISSSHQIQSWGNSNSYSIFGSDRDLREESLLGGHGRTRFLKGHSGVTLGSTVLKSCPLR